MVLAIDVCLRNRRVRNDARDDRERGRDRERGHGTRELTNHSADEDAGGKPKRIPP